MGRTDLDNRPSTRSFTRSWSCHAAYPLTTPLSGWQSLSGWISQLVGLVREAVFDSRWAPTIRLILLALVAVGLYLAVREVDLTGMSAVGPSR